MITLSRSMVLILPLVMTSPNSSLQQSRQKLPSEMLPSFTEMVENEFFNSNWIWPKLMSSRLVTALIMVNLADTLSSSLAYNGR